MRTRTYSELSQLSTFEERFEYLRLDGEVGMETFGFDRYLNQMLYNSQRWRSVRNEVIVRDNACDLGVEGYEISGCYDKDKNYHRPKIIIHHMRPITKQEVLDRDPVIFDPEYLITTTLQTHNAIHYGTDACLRRGPVTRSLNDTCPWK